MFDGSSRERPAVNLAGKKKSRPTRDEIAEKSNQDRKQRELDKKRFNAARAIQIRIRRILIVKRQRRLHRLLFDSLSAFHADDTVLSDHENHVPNFILCLRYLCFFYKPDEDSSDPIRLQWISANISKLISTTIPGKSNLLVLASRQINIPLGSQSVTIFNLQILLSKFCIILCRQLCNVVKNGAIFNEDNTLLLVDLTRNLLLAPLDDANFKSEVSRLQVKMIQCVEPSVYSCLKLCLNDMNESSESSQGLSSVLLFKEFVKKSVELVQSNSEYRGDTWYYLTFELLTIPLLASNKRSALVLEIFQGSNASILMKCCRLMLEHTIQNICLSTGNPISRYRSIIKETNKPAYLPVVHFMNNISSLPSFQPAKFPQIAGKIHHVWIALFDQMLRFSSSIEPFGGIPFQMALYYSDFILTHSPGDKSLVRCSQVHIAPVEFIQDAEGGSTRKFAIVPYTEGESVAEELVNIESTFEAAEDEALFVSPNSESETPNKRRAHASVLPEMKANAIGGVFADKAVLPLFVSCAIDQIPMWNYELTESDRMALISCIEVVFSPIFIQIISIHSDPPLQQFDIQTVTINVLSALISMGGNTFPGLPISPALKSKFHKDSGFLHTSLVSKVINSISYGNPESPL